MNSNVFTEFGCFHVFFLQNATSWRSKRSIKNILVNFRKKLWNIRKNIQLIARLTNLVYTEQANSLRQVTKKHASTFRLEGGGRKVKLDVMENEFLSQMQRQKAACFKKMMKIESFGNLSTSC